MRTRPDNDGLTRRQLLRRAAAGAGTLALGGALAETLGHALAGGTRKLPPLPSRFASRPDLRLPALTVLRNDEGATQDPIFIAPYNAPNAQAGAVIVAPSGEPIWEHPVAERVSTNFRVQHYRGSAVLTWWEGEIELGHGVGEYVVADASYREIRRVQASGRLHGDLHEFVITPEDTALLTSYRVSKADLRAAGGARDGTIQDAIFQEVELASGRRRLEWHSLGTIPYAESCAPVTPDWDFFHINSVDLDADGGLLVSARSTHTVYKLTRDGAIVWRLGGRRSDFAMGPGSEFAWQHHARRRPNGTITIFDNGATPAVERRSRALVLELDERRMSAALRHQYAHPGVLAGSQGSVQLLPNGNVFVGWGEVPRVSEFTADGRLVFDALLGARYESYRAFRAPWTGRPAERPALALGGSGERRTVYASWNGATEVRAWRLAGGEAVPARGFETALPAPGADGAVTVQALDGGGRALATVTA